MRHGQIIGAVSATRVSATLLAVLCLANLHTPSACAADGSDLVVRVVDEKGKALKGVRVRVGLKHWPGGKFRWDDHDAKSSGKGVATVEGLLPTGERYGAYATVAESGRAVASVYRWVAKGEGPLSVELVVPRATPLHLRFVDDGGKPVKGVAYRPVMRATAEWVRHEPPAAAVEKFEGTSDKKGGVVTEAFAAGEWVGVGVRFPGGDWETRNLSVPADGKTVVDIPQTAPVTPDLDLKLDLNGSVKGDGDPSARFFLMGPKAGDVEPADGYGLVLVLPGGAATADFHGFVRERYDAWVDAGYVFAQLVAPKWMPDQPVTWPTEESPIDGMKFTTEEFVDGVVADVAKRLPIDEKRVFTISWSSSGPACYRIAARKKTPVTGSLVAMSVFKRQQMDGLKYVKGRPFFILHSTQDQRCRVRFAEEARDTLNRKKAVVEYMLYEGAHGWSEDAKDKARQGLYWLHSR